MSPACEIAPQPDIFNKDKDHPRYKEWLRYRSSCASQLITASSFESWLNQIEMEKKRELGLLHYQIINAHPLGEQYWRYSRQVNHSHQIPLGLWKALERN